MNTLPTITQQEIDASGGKPGSLITLLINRYRDLLLADTSGEVQASFTIEQNVLMAFDVLDGQVSNGGFIQLIENGFGPYIFDTPLVEHLRDWRLAHTASLIDNARGIYEPKREILEKEKTLQEFARLYQEHPEFELLDKKFDAVIKGEREILESYILEHPEGFMVVMPAS